ncbi:uncharacterized protein LOC110708354 [Chenopodium quinoa]|uniref:uncharacterized protein LOC110708354 n=1 Tax=Chenopodium quinoa TaxID=63459 RepID=UPI000B78D170|nr:uncharacterized protein LOC110708354 [Chenopodium quinoa]
MASEQQMHGATRFTDKEMTAINEVVKEAQTLLENKNNGKVRQLATVAGTVMNFKGQQIMLNTTQEWFGHFIEKPPITIGGHGSGTFVHRAPSFPKIPGYGPGPAIAGCKAAVIYGYYDKDVPQLGWLLAWYKSQNSAEHKVYVEAGLLEVLQKREWSEIEEKLDASGSACRYYDSVTGAAAAAEIKDHGYKLAYLGACFDCTNSAFKE